MDEEECHGYVYKKSWTVSIGWHQPTIILGLDNGNDASMTLSPMFLLCTQVKVPRLAP